MNMEVNILFKTHEAINVKSEYEHENHHRTDDERSRRFTSNQRKIQIMHITM